MKRASMPFIAVYVGSGRATASPSVAATEALLRSAGMLAWRRRRGKAEGPLSGLWIMTRRGPWRRRREQEDVRHS